MESKYPDIEAVVLDITRNEMVANDSKLDRSEREATLVDFMQRNSAVLIDFLDELKTLRERTEGAPLTGGLEKSHRVILEGFSDKSAEEALSSALDKAAHYFAEDKDVSITIQQLMELSGGGHRAVLEVHITPMNLRMKPHVKGADIELKRDHDKAFQRSHRKEDEALQHLIFDHFSALTKSKTMGHIPQGFLINVTDAKLMHYMLERQFLKAERALKLAEKKHEISAEEPQLIYVRLNHK